jgi:hypothetical protein
MDIDPTNDGATSVEQSSAEQHPYVDTQQGENSTQNHTNSEQIVKVKKTPMNPTPLYIAFFFYQPS